MQLGASAPTLPNPIRDSSQLPPPLYRRALALLLTAALVICMLIALIICFWDKLRACFKWRQGSSRPEGGSREDRMPLVADEQRGIVDEGNPAGESATPRETGNFQSSVVNAGDIPSHVRAKLQRINIWYGAFEGASPSSTPPEEELPFPLSPSARAAVLS